MAWWKVVRPTDRDPTWIEFQRMLENKYYLKPVREARIQELFSTQAHDVPVVQTLYNHQLTYVRAVIKMDKNKLRHFIPRKKPKIKHYMAGYVCTTPKEYRDRALAYEISFAKAEFSPESNN